MADSIPKILIVDDEDTILQALNRVLSREGYDVYTTNNPLQVPNILENLSIDLVISDIMMNEMSGLDLIKQLKSIAPHIPIVLITGNPNLNTAQEALRHQAFDYIPKPVERSKILDVAKRAVDFKRSYELEVRENEENRSMAESLSRRNQDLNLQNTIILDATKDFVITFLHDGTIYSMNKSAKERFETESRPLIGSKIEVLFPDDKLDAYKRLFRMATQYHRSSTIHRIEVDLVDRSSKRVTTEISFCQYYIDNQSYYTGIFRDNSEKKYLTQRLIESEKRAFLNTIAASIGHEINNALTAIMGFVEVAMQPDSGQDVKERAIQVTMSQADKLKNLTSNLLTLGKTKENWEDTDESYTDLNEVLSRVLDVFNKSKRIKNCKLEIEMNPTPVMIVGSRDKLELALSNLILNAADATHNQGVIKLSTQLRNGEPIFQIRDNGVGMTKEVMSKIYDPYFTTKEIGKGTGLGMFVVKEIAHLYGIKIFIESRPNEGSTFLLHFKNAKKN